MNVVDSEVVPDGPADEDVEAPSTSGVGVELVGSGDVGAFDTSDDVASTGNESSAASSAGSITDFCGVPRTESAAYSSDVILNS